MHVGLIVEHSDPRRGGAERFAVSLAERIRGHGHRVSVCSRTGPQARPVRTRPAGLRPRFYAETFLPWLRNQGAEVVLTFPPVPGCDYFQPRMGLLQAAIPPHLDPVAQPLRFLRRINPVRRLHFHRLRRFEAEALRPPSVLLTHSPRVISDLARFYPGAREPRLIRTGVDLERLHPAQDGFDVVQGRARLGLPPGPLLVFVAHNYLLKGLRTALRALARLDGVNLAVAGNGREASFRRLAARHGVGARVFWRGEEAELPLLYRVADLLVHPTYYDAAARVVLEALASGTPAITTSRDGNADVAREAGGAVLDDPSDDSVLGERIGRLLGTERAVRAARARAVAERFPADRLLDAMVELLVCGSTS